MDVLREERVRQPHVQLLDVVVPLLVELVDRPFDAGDFRSDALGRGPHPLRATGGNSVSIGGRQGAENRGTDCRDPAGANGPRPHAATSAIAYTSNQVAWLSLFALPSLGADPAKRGVCRGRIVRESARWPQAQCGRRKIGEAPTESTTPRWSSRVCPPRHIERGGKGCHRIR